MVSIQHSKRSDSKQCTVEVRWGIFIENLTIFFNPQSSCKYSQTNSYNFAMTLIFQDDHLTAGAWAACEWVCMTWPLMQYQFRQICLTVNSYISLFHPMFLFLYLFFSFIHQANHQMGIMPHILRQNLYKIVSFWDFSMPHVAPPPLSTHLAGSWFGGCQWHVHCKIIKLIEVYSLSLTLRENIQINDRSKCKYMKIIYVNCG